MVPAVGLPRVRHPTAATRYDGVVSAAPSTPGTPPGTPHLARFYTHVLAHATALGPERGAGWLLDHGLLSLEAHPDLPEPFHQPLRDAGRRNLAHNLLLVHRYRAAADALGDLPHAALKGIHLLDTAYREDPQHRVLADLDLLVRTRDGAEALRRLADTGYRETELSRRSAAHRHERVVSDGDVTLELHIRLGVQPGHRTDWEDLAPVPRRLHDRPAHVLDPATTLVHLVVHFVKHGPFSLLRWAEDPLRWSAVGDGGGPLDGRRAFARARELGAARSFVAGVRALRAVAGAGWLAGVPRRPGGTAGLLVAAHERWLWPSLRAASPGTPLACGDASSPWRRNLSALLLADRPLDALRFLVDRGRELAVRRASHRANG